ncbi:hypothetical protein HDU82_003768 [Entophlyctis luteolus]|nr:hypothetical protein HDU82_003768 [Entophlyctis luteolus]KAJ3391241.1 hypothetical protein HDU84_006305 [Entophlyctis sp. JEL0112]
MISKAAYAAAGTTAAVNAIGYAVSALRRTEAYFDLCGTGSYLASSIAVLAAKGQGAASLHPRQLLMLLTTSAWSLRLLVFLTNRVHRMGRDSRFDQVKQKPLVFAGFVSPFATTTLLSVRVFTVVWVELVSLPTVAVLAADSAGMPALNWKDWIGLTVWAFGFVYEAIADQ